MKKSKLPDSAYNEYSVDEIDMESLPSTVLVANIETVLSTMKNLDESSATGPDGVPAILLKRCRLSIGPVLLVLISAMVFLGHLPDWRLHWLQPIYERDSHSKASNYRGVHLTPQISKTIERVIVVLLRPFLSFGEHQFAYTPSR